MNTITGRGAAAVAGAQMLRCKQSSVPENTPLPSSCGHTGPSALASISAVGHANAAGGAKRSAPVGGAAYDTPQYAHVVPTIAPCSMPLVVETCSFAAPAVGVPHANASGVVAASGVVDALLPQAATTKAR